MPQDQPYLFALDHLVLTVTSIPNSIAFYENVLGMTSDQFRTAQGEVRWALKFGRSKINLHQAGREFDPKAARPTAGSADLCFLTEGPLADWLLHLEALQVHVEEGPVSRTGAKAALTSIYIRDPDGNLIEISVEDGDS